MSYGEMQPKKTNWFLWIALIGGFAVVLPVACCGGVVFFGFNMVKKPVETAAAALEQDERVAQKIGTPISYDAIVMSNYQNDNGNGGAGIDTNFTGPNGSVHAQGTMKLVAGVWSVEELTVTFDDGSEITLPEQPIESPE